MCLKLLQDSCSEAMIRLFVFFLNFLFIIVGVVLACIGIWMEVEYTKIEVRNNNSKFQSGWSKRMQVIFNLSLSLCWSVHFAS